MEHTSNRRKFLTWGVGGTAGIISLASTLPKALAQSCIITPAQTSGPFYPGERNFKMDTDLTFVPGSQQRAKGKVVYIRGRVLDQRCRPVEGVNVEVWQACATGRYNHQRDPNPAALDPNFKYWAETFTNEQGEYLFKTIIPGAYPAEANWERPPHIHFRVGKIGFHEVVTQMYFKGEALNDRDYILQNLPTLERESVIVDFKPSPAGFEANTLTGHFDITLRSVR